MQNGMLISIRKDKILHSDITLNKIRQSEKNKCQQISLRYCILRKINQFQKKENERVK